MDIFSPPVIFSHQLSNRDPSLTGPKFRTMIMNEKYTRTQCHKVGLGSKHFTRLSQHHFFIYSVQAVHHS